MKNLHLLHLKKFPIFSQLQLEEALLRTSEENYCIINEGSSKAIVLGISSKLQQHIDISLLKKNEIDVIQRFSGGGSVIVDENTIFVSFILSKKETTSSCDIMQEVATFYKKAFLLPTFSLKENDFVIQDKKCAGNAQYICKKRYVHHTSFLWDFQEELMKILLFPPKTPLYRKNRDHLCFLTRLKSYFKTKKSFLDLIKKELFKTYQIKEQTLESFMNFYDKPHRKSTKKLRCSGPVTYTFNHFLTRGNNPPR